MKKIKAYIANSILLKVTSFNSIAVIVNIVVGILTSKALAEFVGTKGMASVGNLRDFLKTIYALATFGIHSGIIKYTAEHKKDKSQLQRVIMTALAIMSIATLIVSCVLFFGASYWNGLIFKGKEFSYIFKIMAGILPLYVVNLLFLSILNGLEKYKNYILLTIIGYIINLFVTVYLVWQFALDGALIALCIVPSLVIVCSSYFLYKERASLPTWNRNAFSSAYAKKFMSYAIMAAVSAFIFPIVYVFIRNHIIVTIGEEAAGYWEAMLRISNQYLIFITSLLALYVLPKLSENTTVRGFRTIVFSFYKTVMPMFVIGLFLVYFFRIYIIELIYNEDFLPTEELFVWQLTGDFFKVLSLVIAYQLFAKKMLGKYLLVEVVSIVLFYFLSIHFVNSEGIEGVVKAHCVRSVLTLLLLIMLFWNMLFGKITSDSISS